LTTIPFGVVTVAPYFGTSSNAHALGALNPGWASFTVAMSADVCGVKAPLAVVAVGLHVAIGVLLVLVASTHVKYHRAERALSIRILLLGITSAVIWLFVGNVRAMGGVPSTQQYTLDLVGMVSSIILAFVSLLTCSIATGEVKRKPGQSVMAYALSVRRVFKGDLGGAVSFIFLWMVFAYATFAGTVAWLMESQGTGISIAVWRSLFQVGVSLVALAVGIAAVGVLSSCCVRQRRNAAALVLLLLILVFSGYGIVMAYYVDGVTDTRGPVWQLAAFWPMTPILGSTNEWRNMPRLWWNAEDSWIICSLAYVGIAFLSLALATRALARYGGVREE